MCGVIRCDSGTVHKAKERREMKREQLNIANEQDRLTIAAILVKNGYSVRTVKVRTTKSGKTTRTVSNIGGKRNNANVIL